MKRGADHFTLESAAPECPPPALPSRHLGQAFAGWSFRRLVVPEPAPSSSCEHLANSPHLGDARRTRAENLESGLLHQSGTGAKKCIAANGSRGRPDSCLTGRMKRTRHSAGMAHRQQRPGSCRMCGPRPRAGDHQHSTDGEHRCGNDDPGMVAFSPEIPERRINVGPRRGCPIAVRIPCQIRKWQLASCGSSFKRFRNQGFLSPDNLG